MSVGSTSDAAGAGGGLAALMVASNPNLTPEQIKAAMIAGVDTIASMQGQLVSNVRTHLVLREPDVCCLHNLHKLEGRLSDSTPSGCCQCCASRSCLQLCVLCCILLRYYL